MLEIISGIVLLLVLLFLMGALKKSERKQRKSAKKESRMTEQDWASTRRDAKQEDPLPPGFRSAEPILQDLYERRRLSDAEFQHYNRFNARDLGQILIDDRICSERDLPMDLRRFLED